MYRLLEPDPVWNQTQFFFKEKEMRTESLEMWRPGLGGSFKLKKKLELGPEVLFKSKK
jgi:hypothetical protein